jgi:hypothetical protein
MGVETCARGREAKSAQNPTRQVCLDLSHAHHFGRRDPGDVTDHDRSARERIVHAQRRDLLSARPDYPDQLTVL